MKKQNEKIKLELTEADWKKWSLKEVIKSFFERLNNSDPITIVKTIIRLILWLLIIGISLYGLIIQIIK